jgi:DNA-binding transcriptional regulator GbsR (MarR family)
MDSPFDFPLGFARGFGKNRAGLGGCPYVSIPRASLLRSQAAIDYHDLRSVDSAWTERFDMANLTGVQQKYILHWGEMGTRWGINRTVAQIHALLYLSPRALPAEEIAETLSVARSNVSTSIRELETWGIVRAVHVLGDRREHYESMKDVWEMFRLVIEQRKRREIDPTREMLKRSLEEIDPRETGAEFTRERLAAMAGFFDAVTELHDQMKSLPTGTVRKLLRMGAKVSGKKK